MSEGIAQKYSIGVKIVHWLLAIAIITMLFVGFFLDDIPEAYKGTAYMLHKSTGITILFLMILRFVVVHVSRRPDLPKTMKLWERFLSRFVQYGFYILLILMPLSGWIMSVAANKIPSYFGLFNLPLPGVKASKSLSSWMFETHQLLAWIIIVFLALHVLGALKHHFIDKDGVLKSML